MICFALLFLMVIIPSPHTTTTSIDTTLSPARHLRSRTTSLATRVNGDACKCAEVATTGIGLNRYFIKTPCFASRQQLCAFSGGLFMLSSLMVVFDTHCRRLTKSLHKLFNESPSAYRDCVRAHDSMCASHSIFILYGSGRFH